MSVCTNITVYVCRNSLRFTKFVNTVSVCYMCVSVCASTVCVVMCVCGVDSNLLCT